MKNVEDIFKCHWEYYRKKEATDIAQIIGMTKHLSDEYQGRVIYELMQNAFDPANEIVSVEIKTIQEKSYLVVSNDGTRFGFKEFDYSKQLKPMEDDNFHALCSIATSSKTVEKNIGNKGVGFKSVFSLSNEVYIVSKQENNEIITFKLFGKIEKCEFEEVTKNIDIDLSVQKQLFQNKETLIPGFYYPLLQSGNYFNQFIDNTIETAIVIPLNNNQKTQVQNLITDIKGFHFEFIKEKYKAKVLQVYINRKKFDQETIAMFSEDKCAILWKNNTSAHLYNFMPSLVKSPFQCVDINGEFQTSVNREYINFDSNSEIGRKNLIILTSAIELHFEKIRNLEINEKNKDVFWKLLYINNEDMQQIVVQVVLNKFSNWSCFGDYIAKLASNYFSRNDLTIDNFDNFWKVIEIYTEISSQNKSYTKTYKYKLKELFLDKLSNKSARVIPIGLTYDGDKVLQVVETQKSLEDKIFYKDDKNNEELSDKLNIYLTNYSFSKLTKDVLLDKATKCTVKRFVDYNEILKSFRQVSRRNEYDEVNSFSEEDQKEVLRSLFNIYLAKTESKFESTHRYEEILSNKNSSQLDYIKMAAETAIATIFLKVGNNKYKPAQFCSFKEISMDFIDFKIPDDIKKKESKSIEYFLKYLGVSFDDNIRYTDFENRDLLEGLDYIPSLCEDGEKQENIKYIPKMRLYYKSGDDFECKHPALFHKSSTYNKILSEIKSVDNGSLSIVVKKLACYKKEYIHRVVELLQENKTFEKNIVFKIYSEIFKQYKKPRLIYRAIDGSFEWIDKLMMHKHYIAKTKEDFELLERKVDLLATFKDVSEDGDLKDFQANIKFKIEIDEHNRECDIKKRIGDEYIPYILLAITDSDISGHNFLEDEMTELLKFNKRWLDLNFLEVEELKPKIKFDNKEFEIEEIEKPIRIEDTVYYKEEHKYKLSDFTNVIVDFFNIEKLQSEIKLILMGEISDYNKTDLEQIYLKWIKIDEKTRNEIINKLKKIGFKEDITFSLNYSQNDFKIKDHKDATQKNIQQLINKIPELKNLNVLTINFDCEQENRKFIELVERKYKLIDLKFEDKSLLDKVLLTEDELYASLDPIKTKKELELELSEKKNENLKKDWNLVEKPKVPRQDIPEEISNNLRSANVSSFTSDSHSNRTIKMAQNRGHKIEEELIDILHESYNNDLENITCEAKNIFEELKKELLKGTNNKRFNLKSIETYQQILNNGDLKKILHISKNLGDGLGFDVLYPYYKNSKLELLKVEVKSSSDGNTIYLSENERKQILLYANDKLFRIYLYIKDKSPKDITKLVFNILKKNRNFINIKAETWILNIKTKD